MKTEMSPELLEACRAASRALVGLKRIDGFFVLAFLVRGLLAEMDGELQGVMRDTVVDFLNEPLTAFELGRPEGSLLN